MCLPGFAMDKTALYYKVLVLLFLVVDIDIDISY